MKKRSMAMSIAAVLSTFTFLFLSIPFSAYAKTTTLSMVTFLPDIPPGNTYVHIFLDKVKSISNGEMKISLMGGPEAIPPADAPAAVKNGVVQIGNVMYVFVNAMVQGLDALARTEYSPQEMRANGGFKFVQDLVAKFGLFYLGASAPSLPQTQTVIYLKKPISSIEELKGLKIAAAGGSQKSAIEGLGAVCVPIHFTDYFTAMERGVVDGYNVGIPGILDFGLVPVTGCMLDEPFSSCGGAFIINMKTWNKLPQNHKDVLIQAAIETEKDGSDAFHRIVDDVKKEISDGGVKIVKFSKEDSIKFYKNYRDKMGEEDLSRWPEFVTELHKYTLNPDFYRLK